MKKYYKEFIMSVVAVVFLGSIFLSYCTVNKEVVVHKQITDNEVFEIYNNLIKYTGIPDFNPSLSIEKAPVLNAWANGGTNKIVIYTGLINYLNDKDAIAAVLGHELGHIMMMHSYIELYKSLGLFYQVQALSPVLEGNADKFSTYLLLRAGYDPCKARLFWEKLRNDNGDTEIIQTHPNYSYRYWQLDFPMCHGR